MDKLVSYFQNMKTEEMVLFITIVVCIITLIVMSISLASKNAELRKIINKLSKEKEEAPKKENPIINKDTPKFVLNKFEEEKEEPKNNLYSKNILNEVGTKEQTSPLTVGKTSYIDEDQIQKLKPIEILEEDNYGDESEEEPLDEEENNTSFVEEISKQIEKDLEPKTIELTDFERRQEEDAIISYDELIKNKSRSSRYVKEDELLNQDNTYEFTTEDDDEFLKELKSFRNDL